MTIIGVDPHPGHHTSAAVDQQGVLLETKTFPNTQEGLVAFLTWLSRFTDSRLAVEGPTQSFFIQWTTRLLAEGFSLVPIPPHMVSSSRRRQARGKSDRLDAQLIARALLAHPQLVPLSLPSWLEPLRELVRTRLALATDLKRCRMRLDKVQQVMPQHSLQRLILTLQQEVRRLEREIARTVRQLAPQLLQVPGVGPVLAGVLLVEVGDCRRFRDADAFASYCGAAPLLWQSGASRVIRVNPGGNRRLNWALHLIALTRKRLDSSTRAFFQRKVAEGKGMRGAFRALKTYIARELYHLLLSLWKVNP
ncbi:MAG: IS110 family transposase, partial [Dehalococcoidia bacterium]